MPNDKEIDFLYKMFITIEDSSYLTKSKKYHLFKNLMSHVDWCYRVTGITEAALDIFHKMVSNQKEEFIEGTRKI